jgi:hypothetical protein
MNSVHVTLLVALKGADLHASTASITLREKMGYADSLAGLRRLDRYRFRIESGAPAATLASALQRVLDRRSTFYNRNKHEYALSVASDGDVRRSGVAVPELRERWARRLGAPEHTRVVEIAVHDDDDDARAALGATLQADLAPAAEDVSVACEEASTVWWLALTTTDGATAVRDAGRIAVTRARDEGLLANPNYQRVDIGEPVTLGDFIAAPG